MPRHMTEQEREAFLAEPHVGVMSVAIGEKSPPLTAPTWYGYEPGGNITIFTGTLGGRPMKVDALEKAGVLSFCVQKETYPYKYVTVEGSIVKTDRPPSADQVKAIVRRYLGDEQASAFADRVLGKPNSEFVHYTVRPDRWLTSDYTEDGA